MEHKCVLPSIESLQRPWKDPKTYCIFYVYFYTATVGEVRWKEYLLKEEGQIGSNTMEAFAHLVLVNNYKAWLYEEKKTHQKGLLTEYDCPRSYYGKPSIIDKILDGVQFDMHLRPTMESATASTLRGHQVIRLHFLESNFLRSLKNRTEIDLNLLVRAY